MTKFRYRINGKEVTLKEFQNHGPKLLDLDGLRKHKGHSCSTYPRWSDALGINPDDTVEQMASDKYYGVPTEYHPETGQARITDRGHDKRLAEHNSMFNLNGGYGDPQRGGRN